MTCAATAPRSLPGCSGRPSHNGTALELFPVQRLTHLRRYVAAALDAALSNVLGPDVPGRTCSEREPRFQSRRRERFAQPGYRGSHRRLPLGRSQLLRCFAFTRAGNQQRVRSET
jgi:hypothetical protein